MARRRSRSGGDTGQLGKWAFIIGGLVALIHAFYPVPYATWILVIAGLIIGTVNIKERDAIGFLIVLVALVVGGIGGWLGMIPSIGVQLKGIINNVITLLSPAALVVALKVAYAMTKR